MRRAAASRAGNCPARRGQAMVETIVALLFALFAFLAVFQYADNLRTKLLLKYAAFRCARARTVGYNDYKILKTARLATMSAAGESLAKNDAGNPLSTGDMLARMRTYISSRHDGAARHILDFDYWENGRTPMPQIDISGGKIEIETRQRRPQFFDIFAFFGGERAVFDTSSERGDDAPDFDLHGRAAIEAHYTDYLQ